MTRIKQTALVALSAMVAVAAIAFARAQSKLSASAPTVGALAPAYSLTDQDGKMHTLADDKGHVVLLAFYPADFTGGCTIEAHALSSAYSELKAQGVTVYGVSVQDPKSHKSFCSKEGIPYTLLADTEKKMSADYGVLIPGIGIANRVTYIIGADGKVAYVDKAVNSHLNTCGEDWAAWIKAHPGQLTPASLRSADIGVPISASTLLVWRSLETTEPFQISGSVQQSKEALTIGKGAFSFTLPDASTSVPTTVTTLAKGKKATVIMFVSTRCPVSNAYNERMVALAKKYAAQSVAFMGIDADQNEPKAEIASFSKEHGFTFPVLVDRGNKVSDAYNAHVTPETYVIDSKGVLVYHGRIDNDMDTENVKTHELADALDAMLAGKPVVRAQTKAFGCSIKRG